MLPYHIKTKLSLGLYAMSADQLNDPDAATLLPMNITSFIHFGPRQIMEHRCTFPLEVDISYCSYMSASNMKMRLGVGLDWSDPLRYERAVYSERLALEEMEFE